MAPYGCGFPSLLTTRPTLVLRTSCNRVAQPDPDRGDGELALVHEVALVSSGMNCGQSPCWPGVGIRLTGRQRRSATGLSSIKIEADGISATL
jgi:hypothetical protein